LRLVFPVWGFGVELSWFKVTSVWRHCRFFSVRTLFGTGTRLLSMLPDLC
jgi:hypothetical protein